MLHKEAAIAVMIAVMLGTASLFGGFSLIPALATHDSDAIDLATEEVTQEGDEWVIIDAVELDAKKLTSRVMGTVTVEIIQGGDVRESASFGTGALKTSFSTVEVDVTNVNVTGSFEILAEYVGSGVVTVNHIGIVEGTTIADSGGNGGENGGAENENPDSPPQEEVLENVIATKAIAQDDGDSMTVEVVEFDAKKLTSRVSGTVTVALVQDDVILDQATFSTSSLKTSYMEMEATFDEEITGDFDVVFMYEGSGVVYVNGINVPGGTSPAEEQPTTDESEMVELTVEAEDEDGEPLPGMFITVWQDFNSVDTGNTPVTFELEDGKYTVQAHDYDDETTNTHIHFLKWKDSPGQETAFRVADLTDFDEETFTAVYTTGETTPAEETPGDGETPGGDETPGDETPGIEDPAPGGPNTVTVQSLLLDGTDASGKLAQLRASNGDNVQEGFTTTELTLAEGQTFNVIMYSFEDEFFRKWSNGHLHRYFTVEGDGTAYALTALYEKVPVDQQAKLQVNARTADGQPIGGTTGSAEDGTLQANPGVEVQIAPPNSMTPFTAYTAGFSGGSEIAEQFFFFDGQTYVVIMQDFGPYKFSHWEDNGDVNSARAVALNGDTTITAVYNVVE